MSNHLKAKLTLALTTAALPLAASAMPESASAQWIDCPDKWLCVWDDQNYTGRHVFYPQNDGSSLFVTNVGDFINDRITSIWNRTDYPICFYNDTNFFGQLLCTDPGGSTANVGPSANDRISSFQRIR